MRKQNVGLIAWPFAVDRREDEGGNLGWGFAAAGAQSGTSWLNSDLLAIGEGSQLRYYYLHASGRWCPVGSTTPAASLTMRLGESYYYLHRGGGFNWTAQMP